MSLSPIVSPVWSSVSLPSGWRSIQKVLHSIAGGYAEKSGLSVPCGDERCHPDCQIDRIILKNPNGSRCSLAALGPIGRLEVSRNEEENHRSAKGVYRKHFIAAAEKLFASTRRGQSSRPKNWSRAMRFCCSSIQRVQVEQISAPQLACVG